MPKKLISYVLPVYNEEDNLGPLYKALTKITKPLLSSYRFEYIFINDASRDESLRKLLALQKKNDTIVVINFARNYGQEIAVTAGLDHAAGDAVIIMDSDLQDPPAVSAELIEKWEQGYHVVYAQRHTRQDTFFKKASAHLFYRLLGLIADIDIPKNTSNFRLIDKKVIAELKRYREHNRFLRGLVSHVGFNQTAVLFDRNGRHSGKTSYSLKRLMKLAGDGVFSFSTAPLRAISNLGYVMAAVAVIGALYAFIIRVFFPQQAVSGWTFLVMSVFLVGGIQLIMLGVLGSYIGRIYTEVQNRPLYSIESIIRKKRR